MSSTWEMPPTQASGKAAVVHTGPSGLVLGKGARGAEVAVRLFRPQGTRVLMDAPDYAKWLLCFRAAALGAHLSVVSEDHRPWRALAEAISRCGGTVDLLRELGKVPGAGRPYRPSLVIDDASGSDAPVGNVGPWQAVAVMESLSASSAVHSLRTSDLALVGQTDGKAIDNLRRAFVLSPTQVKIFDQLESSVVVAMPRKVVKVDFRPTSGEYRLLF